jgi:adenylylsulfate kinase
MTNFPADHHLATESFLVTRQQKEALNRQKAFVIWLTGLSCSGKTTIARYLEVRLFDAGIRTMILDGDNTRQTINRDLDFSPEGRAENIRRVAEMAKLLNDAGVVVITALISPFQKDRERAQEIIGRNCFIEVFVDAPMEVCMQRDTRGLYQKAMNGELKDFTGVDSPYEKPLHPHITLHTANQTPEASVSQIMNFIAAENLIFVPTAKTSK